MSIVPQLRAAISEADMDEAMRLIERWTDENGFEQLVGEVLRPMLDGFGELFGDGEECSLVQSYVASKVAESAFELSERAGKSKPPGRSLGTVILGNIEDDCHPLGRRIVASFLQTHGWDVCDLGIDVEPEAFVDKAVELGARVIGVSAMTFTTAEGLRRVREVIDGRGLRQQIRLAVGGAAFRRHPELAAQVGADGTAPDASAAHDLFARLWNETVQQGGAPDEQ
jgi:methylmalonyl-CoA mutase cobalamin-binding domain/chain